MGRGGSKSKASIKPDRSETPAAATDPMSNSEIHQDMDLDEGYNTGNVVGDGESLKHLGRGVNELVQAVQALRHLGVEDLVLPLPKVVVVGNQSAGKSSLVEAMSEIKVPRDTGTCTRCPLEINLSAATQWSCQVSIHKKYMYEGSLGAARAGKLSIKTEGATRAKPLGPWAVQENEILPFATIKSQSEVPGVLRAAQLAVLNPKDPPEKYAYTLWRPEQEQSYQVKFSPNVIRLDIAGPSLPNLSFYDLPGIINVADVPEEAYLVDLVKNLVKGYIVQEDCINLLAISMTDDPANSSASSLIRDVKAEGRTLGCLTKPDRLQQQESLDQWIQILRGERFRLGYGYHIIKNNPDTSVAHSIARDEEVRFFQKKDPWATTFKGHSQRFGTHNLQNTLSQLLTAQIKKSLPKIYKNVQQKASEIDLALRSLPEPLSGNLAAVVMGELMKFESELKIQIDGGSDSCTFQNDLHTHGEIFRDALVSLRPMAMLSQSYQQTPQRSQGGRNSGLGGQANTPTPAIRLANRTQIDLVDSGSSSDEDSEDEYQSPSASAAGRRRRHHAGSDVQPRKIRKTENHRLQSRDTSQAKKFSLAEVRDIIRTTYIGLPSQVHPKATEKMIRMSTEHWFAPAQHFLDQTKYLCKRMIEEIIHSVFGHRQSTRYFFELLEQSESYLKEICDSQLEMAKRILSWEQDKPRTLAKDNLSKALQEARSLLYERRRYWRAKDYLAQLDQKSSRSSQDQNKDDRINKFTDDDLPAEEFGPELDTLAEVRAYYDCASSRFVDSVFLSVNCEVLRKLRDGLVGSLKDKIGLMEADATSRLALLLAADPRDEEKRNQLKKERLTIRNALEELENVALHAGRDL